MDIDIMAAKILNNPKHGVTMQIFKEELGP